jgi:hypothetical protein
MGKDLKGENRDVFNTLHNHLPGQKQKDKGNYQSSRIAIWLELGSGLL